MSMTDEELEAEVAAQHEYEEEERKNERTLRIAIGLFSAVLLTTLIASIHLSTLGLNFGSVIFGPEYLWRGHDVIYRVAAIDPKTMRPVYDIKAVLALHDSQGEQARASAEGGTYAEVRMTVPDGVESEPIMKVKVTTPLGDDSMNVPLKSLAVTGPVAGQIASHRQALTLKAQQRKSTGSIYVALYPEGGHVVGGVNNDVVARITQEGAPLPTTVKLFDTEYQSDALGTFRFTLPPRLNPMPLEFHVGTEPSQKLQVALDSRATQLLLRVSPHAILKAGEDLAVNVQTLPFRDHIHIDVWAGDQLVWGTSYRPQKGGLKTEIPLSGSLRGWVRVDAYRNFVAPGESYSTKLLWVSDAEPQAALQEAVEAVGKLEGDDPLVKVLQSAPPEQQEQLLPVVLSRFQPLEVGMPMLASSLDNREDKVNNERDSQRRHVNFLFAATLVLGLGLVLSIALRHQSRVRQRLRDVVDEGVAAGDAMDVENAHKLAKARHSYQLLLVLVAVLMAGYAFWVLLTKIRWSY